MAQNFSLKDQLFNAEKVSFLAGLFAKVDSDFKEEAFAAKVMSRLPELELKERMAWIAECLQESVPGDLPAVAPVILRALPPPLDPAKSDDDFGDFIFAPLGDWVCTIGLDHPALALDVFEELTQRFSMEWAIRPFLNHHSELVMARMQGLVHASQLSRASSGQRGHAAAFTVGAGRWLGNVRPIAVIGPVARGSDALCDALGRQSSE